MGQNVLIAFDDSDNAMRAVTYVADAIDNQSRVVLFHVIQDTATLCDMNSPELTPYFKSQQSAFCQLEDAKRGLVTDAMEAARQRLIDAGFDPKRLDVKTVVKDRGVARDIAAEAENGYDLVVLGRHGVSGIKDYFMGTIAQRLTQLVEDAAILIVN